MQKIVIFTVIILIWYSAISFVVNNFQPLTWHWAARLVFIFLAFYTISKMDDIQDRYK